MAIWVTEVAPTSAEEGAILKKGRETAVGHLSLFPPLLFNILALFFFGQDVIDE